MTRAWAWAVIALAGLSLPVAAPADTVTTQSLVADMTRRPVPLKAQDGKAITAEQVFVDLRRRDGMPVKADRLNSYARFAERSACGSRQVLASVIIGTSEGAGRFEVLCAGAE